MDSMRSLNTSLPRPPRRRRSDHPPEQLLQSFKNAALSVTNLYRTAEANDNRSRQSGYQDALDEILSFLDRENIGLCDGEGWRVRQWATERLDDQPGFQGGSESEEERVEPVKAAVTTPPTNYHRPNGQPVDLAAQIISPLPVLTSSHIDDQPPPVSQDNIVQQSSGVFTFRSSCPLPQDTEMQPPTIATVDMSSTESVVHSQSPPAITVNVLSRNTKPTRGSRHPPRATTVRGLGPGAGAKRRTPFGDYFDMSTLEGLGGGKRGKLG